MASVIEPVDLRCTPGYSDEHMRAALEMNVPNYAGSKVTADEIVAVISALADLDSGQRDDFRPRRKPWISAKGVKLSVKRELFSRCSHSIRRARFA